MFKISPTPRCPNALIVDESPHTAPHHMWTASDDAGFMARVRSTSKEDLRGFAQHRGDRGHEAYPLYDGDRQVAGAFEATFEDAAAYLCHVRRHCRIYRVADLHAGRINVNDPWLNRAMVDIGWLERSM